LVWPQKIVFFGVPCVFLFFGFNTQIWRFSQTKKKHKVFLVFAFQNQKNKKKQGKPKKTSFEAKPKSFFKVLFFVFWVLRFWGYCHCLHITSFQKSCDFL